MGTLMLSLIIIGLGVGIATIIKNKPVEESQEEVPVKIEPPVVKAPKAHKAPKVEEIKPKAKKAVKVKPNK